MPSITMTCPSGGSVRVSGGNICVCGKYFDTFSLKQFLLAIFRAIRSFVQRLFGHQPLHNAVATPPTVWVRVKSGAPTSQSAPPQAGDLSAGPSGQAWCVQNVPVPAGTQTGDELTAYSWLQYNGSIVDGPHSASFTAGGSGATDCCSGCASGAPGAWLATELASHPPLEVAVPDGPNAGRHMATAVAHLTWAMTVRGVIYKLACDNGAALVIRGPSSAEPSTAVERGPFSATFPGAVLGSAGEVVVTKA